MFFSGTGFSREEADMDTLDFAVLHPTLSRLKPVPLTACGGRLAMFFSGTGFSREEAGRDTVDVAV